MLSGLYRTTDGPVEDLAAFTRLRDRAGPTGLHIAGRFAVAATAEGAAAGLGCWMSGYLYGRERAIRRSMNGRGAADANAIAHAQSTKGDAGLAELRGRFSAAMWDEHSGRGVLVNDLLAVQPLFLRHGTGYVAFATELRDLLDILPTRPGPDTDGFIAWLGGGRCPPGVTIYEGVTRLRPGELAELADGGFRVRRYWTPSYQGTAGGTRSDWADGLREQLRGSVRRRIADLDAGVILSGGLDSSIVTAVGTEVKPPDSILRSYSAYFPGEPQFDESWKVERLRESLGFDARAFELAPQGALWLAIQHARRWCTPLIGAAGLLDCSMARLAGNDGIDVVLDGQTGDEVLGFAPYLMSDLLAHGRFISAWRLGRSWPLGRVPSARDVRWILKEVGLKGLMPYRLGELGRARRDRQEIGARWLRPDLRARSLELDDKWRWKAAHSGPRWWRQLADTLIEAPHRELRLDYLRHRAYDGDVANESPLYDFDLINFCLQLPPEHGFVPAHTRPLAREAVADLIPDDVRLNDQKADFSSFCFRTLTEGDAPGIERLITGDDAQIGAYADLEWVRDLWFNGRPGPGAGKSFWGTTIWRVLAAEAWLRSEADPDTLTEVLDRRDVPEPAVTPVGGSTSRTFLGPSFSGLASESRSA
jgi:asparagine synthase (glutamine-hydrolysing)